jgi:hypothetical protein
VEKHPEFRLTFTVNTNKGSIRYGEQGEHHNVSEFLFKGDLNAHDLYTVKLSEKDRIGIGVFVIDKITGNEFYDVRSEDNLKLRIGGFDDTYTK